MDKDFFKQIVAFADAADPELLREKLEELRVLKAALSEPAVRADTNTAIRILERELVTKISLKKSGIA